MVARQRSGPDLPKPSPAKCQLAAKSRRQRYQPSELASFSAAKLHNKAYFSHHDPLIQYKQPNCFLLFSSFVFCFLFLVAFPDVGPSSMNASSTFLRRVTTTTTTTTTKPNPARWSWTCTACRGRAAAARGPLSKRLYSSYSRPTIPKRRGVWLFASVGAAGASVLAVADDVKATYEGVERAGRVASALFICINEYVQISQPVADVRGLTDLGPVTERR